MTSQPDARSPWHDQAPVLQHAVAPAQPGPRQHDGPPVVPAAVLDGRGLVKAYGSTRALAGVSISVGAGQSLAVMGPSGSGKTTLLHVLAGILRPDGGAVHLEGTDIARMSDGARSTLRRSRFGFVFQSGQLLPELPSVENVALPLMLGGMSRREATGHASAWFAPLGLHGLERRRPGELSGGQAQRVAIARALVTRPSVVFADEPTGALDQTTGREVMGVLTQAAVHNGAALVVVTHDPSVASWCRRVVTMRDGSVVADVVHADGDARVPAGATR